MGSDRFVSRKIHVDVSKFSLCSDKYVGYQYRVVIESMQVGYARYDTGYGTYIGIFIHVTHVLYWRVFEPIVL